MECPCIPANSLLNHGGGISGIARGLPTHPAKDSKQVWSMSVVGSSSLWGEEKVREFE